MKIWQIAAGDGTRDYADVFLRFGVILVGPGSEGDYFSNQDAYNNTDSWACRPFIRPLAEELVEGDLVVLKRPNGYKWEIVAVGEIASDYLFMDIFSDVDGWDLQHCRQVNWKTPTSQTVIVGLRRGTFVGVNHQQAVAEVQQVWAVGSKVTTIPIPDEPEEISIDQLIDALMIEGLSGQSAELIANTIWRLRRIAKWYGSHGSDVGEHEIRTFLIVPLLISLGWAEQKVKIEWNNIDVVLFDTPYSEQSKPFVIIESKRLWDGLRYAPDQAARYAKLYPTCDWFVVSDGIRYKLFKRRDDQWHYTAYMNLLAPKRTHPYEPDVDGAVSFFLNLIPKGLVR
jgi:hypothetical protein